MTFTGLRYGGGLAVRRGSEHSERREGEEPRQVQVGPMRQHELEAEQQRGGERGELERRLPARHEVGRYRADYEQDLEHALEHVQIRQARVVLPPVADRKSVV